MREMKGHSGQLYVWIAKCLLARFGEGMDFTHAEAQDAVHQAAIRAPRSELMIWAHEKIPSGITRYSNAAGWVISSDLPYSGLSMKRKHNCYYFPIGSVEYFSKASDEEILTAMNDGWARHTKLKKEGKLKKEDDASQSDAVVLKSQEDINNWNTLVNHLTTMKSDSPSFQSLIDATLGLWKYRRVEIKLEL